MDKKLKINEIFSSIQGESTCSGRPCVFIRLAGCNLNCTYCDTEYAKTAENAEELSLVEIVEIAEKSGIKLVEITGGEPLIQDGVAELCRILLEKSFTVLLETNGSLRISQIPADVVKIIDCKAPSSGEADRMDFANFADLQKHDQIKFVVANRTDYEHAKKIISKYNLDQKVDDGNILFGAVSPSELNPEQLAEWLVEDKLNARLQVQLHKIIGAK